MKKRLWFGGIAVVVAVCIALFLSYISREGADDQRPAKPGPADGYVGYLAHSADECNSCILRAWRCHLTAWWVTMTPDGKIARKHVPSSEVWFRLKPLAKGVVQLPEKFMNAEMPVVAEPAT